MGKGRSAHLDKSAALPCPPAEVIGLECTFFNTFNSLGLVKAVETSLACPLLRELPLGKDPFKTSDAEPWNPFRLGTLSISWRMSAADKPFFMVDDEGTVA